MREQRRSGGSGDIQKKDEQGNMYGTEKWSFLYPALFPSFQKKQTDAKIQKRKWIKSEANGENVRRWINQKIYQQWQVSSSEMCGPGQEKEIVNEGTAVALYRIDWAKESKVRNTMIHYVLKINLMLIFHWKASEKGCTLWGKSP